MPDPVFEDPRLAEIYDPLDPDRRDLDPYAAMVEESLPPLNPSKAPNH